MTYTRHSMIRSAKLLQYWAFFVKTCEENLATSQQCNLEFERTYVIIMPSTEAHRWRTEAWRTVMKKFSMVQERLSARLTL